MPDNEVIAARLQVDTGTSNANIKEVKKNLDDVKESLKTTGNEAKTTGKGVESAGGSFSKLKETMGTLPGPLGEATEGVGKLNTSFKALLANPIGLVLAAIVAILATLYAAFKNTFEGGEKLEQVFAGIKAAGQALLDNLGKIGSAIVKVFTFDFSGAVADIKGVADAAAGAYNKMAALTKEAQNLAREQSTNDLEQAERAKKLAVLREQANDESISPAERKKALLELREEARKNAIEDVDLANRTAANKIAALKLQDDGEKKNFKEINDAKIEAIKVDTDNANELRRIDKQVTAANKQELAERKAAEKEAADAAKQRRQELVEYTNKLTKLQQENELLGIKDSYAKEIKQLENKLADEKRANDLAFQDNKITRAQQAKLNDELDKQFALQTDAAKKKHDEEVSAKEAEFQKELASIRKKITVDGVADTRQAERVALQIGYEEKLQDAIKRYKDDAGKLQQIREALAEQQRAEQKKLQDKFDLEDAKKAFKIEDDRLKRIIDKKGQDFDEKRAAVDADIALAQEAFDKKLISEEDYNSKHAALTEARKQIDQAEADNKLKLLDSISAGLQAVSSIVGKNTVAGKALAAAASAINTYAAIAGQLKAFSGVPIPGYAIAQAITTGLVGFKAVTDILKVQVPASGGSGGGSAPSISAPLTPAAPLAPTQIGVQLPQAQINAAGNQKPLKAYVVASENTAAVNREARLQGAAILGGG